MAKYPGQRASLTITSAGLFPTTLQAMGNSYVIDYECEEEEGTEWNPPANARQYDPGLVSRAELSIEGFCDTAVALAVASWQAAGRGATTFDLVPVSSRTIHIVGHEYAFSQRGTVGSKVTFSLRVKWNGSVGGFTYT